MLRKVLALALTVMRNLAVLAAASVNLLLAAHIFAAGSAKEICIKAMQPRARSYLVPFIIFFGGASALPPCFAQTAAKGSLLRLTLPQKDWSLDISLQDARLYKEEIGADNHSYKLETAKGSIFDLDTFVMFEVYIDPLSSQLSSSNILDYAIRTLEKTKGVKKGSLSTSQYNALPIIRYDRKYEIAYNTTQDFPVNIPQQTIDAYVLKDESLVTIRISAKLLRDAEMTLFHGVLDSVKIIDNTHPTTSFDFYSKGRSLVLQKNYASALNEFNSALRLELQKRELDLVQWRGLVEGLTESCSATGNLTAAKAALEYGIKNDPAYALFYLAFARLYAFKGDLDNTISSMQKAFMYSEGNVQSPPIRDPMFDPAFERFRKDERFRKAVRAMKKP
jgi:tetratricopeptide (TPR) repeat protein